MMSWSVLAAALAFTAPALASVPAIKITGAKFFYENNGTEFFIRGVAYQEPYDGSGTSTSAGTVNFIDPLADEASCARDLPYLLELNTNVVRVYAVDPNADHSGCMNLFGNAGIYVLADLSSPDQSINRDSPSWDTGLYTYYTTVVDSLANYTNTLGFFAGNEVANSANTTGSSAFVKAAVRDMKSYISSKGYRSIPVGYSAADVVSIRVQLADYLNCGAQSDAIDFFGDNVYEWCGDSSYTESGYDDITAEFSNYSVPYFFSEYGCNTVQPRTFTNVPVMYGPKMDGFLTGGVVYEYFQGANNFGLVTLQGSSISTMTDFAAFSTEIATVSPTGVNSASYTPTNSPAACPTVDASWQAASKLPPTPNIDLCECMLPTLSCVLNNSTSSSKYSDLFSTVCGYGACSGIEANYTTGVYGEYSMCNTQQQLSYAFDTYYKAQVKAGNSASACDFGGAATTQSPTSATGTCASLLANVGSAGTTPTGTSSASSTSTKSSAAEPRFIAPDFMNFGLLYAALFTFTSVFAGAGMVLL